MNSLSSASISKLAQDLQQVLTTRAYHAGITSRFVQRRSPQARLDGASFVQMLVFGFLNKPGASLHELCQSGAALGVRLSPQALDQRFTPAAVDLLECVLYAAVQVVVRAAPVQNEILNRFTAVWVCDSTTVALPAPWAERWPGCGGGHGGGESALKLHVRADLKQGRWQGPLLTSGREQDQATPLAYHPLEAGSLHIADLGFFNLKQFLEWNKQNIFWLSRVRAGTQVWEEGRCFELSALLGHWQRAAPDKVSQFEGAVELGAARVPCRLWAWRLPPSLAAQQRGRLLAEAKRKGQAVSRERLRLAGWTILASNAPARLLSQAEALVLYRARWQIERLFRLWKEVGEIDGGPGWRSQKAERILCEVYAKLLGQIVEHWVILSSGGWQDESRSLHQMAQTVQKHALIMASALGRFGDLRRLEHALEVIGFCLTSGCQVNTRKKKPSLAQLLRDPFLSCFP